MAPRETRWMLFVDESGKFEIPTQTVVVTGILVRDDVRGSRPGELRQYVRTHYPEWPWPLHAAFINQGVMFAVHAYVAHRQGNSAKKALAESAIAQLRAVEPELVDKVIGASTEGREPDLRDVKRLNGRLWGLDPELRTRLDSKVRRVWEAVREVVKSMKKQAADGVLLLTASDSEQPAPTVHERSLPEQDRYLQTLKCLLVRVKDVLEIREGKHRVGAYVLKRTVYDKMLGRKVPLDIRLVAALRPAPTSVTLIIYGVVDFSGLTGATTADEPLVVVDFASNRALQKFAHKDGRTQPLAAIEQQLERFGAVRSGLSEVLTARAEMGECDTVSHLAAVGSAEGFIQSRLMIPFPGAPVTNWAWEQAQKWVCVKLVMA